SIIISSTILHPLTSPFFPYTTLFRSGAYVIGTASTRNQAFLRQLGVDEPTDYEKTRFEDVVHDVDVVLDPIGGDTQKRSWKTLKDRKSTRLNSSHQIISYAVFCLKKT